MATVRTEEVEYRGYRVDVLEWCGLWQPRLWPLAPDLPAVIEMQMVDATAPSLEAAGADTPATGAELTAKPKHATEIT